MMEVMPIIEVTENNLGKMMPAVLNAIKMSSFIAIDCELSGLGNRKNLKCPEIDMRYKFSADVARSHAIISLGLACFSCRSMSSVSTTDDEGKEVSAISSHAYLVQTFNFLTLCADDYMVECDALKFLLHHGFDFNKQYREGIKYHRGSDREAPQESAKGIRDIFTTIIAQEKPLVLHNGLVDLLFLYQSFYADLPRKMETFAADLNEMFPNGIYDTKYLAEYRERIPATYLEFVYKKMQLRNEKKRKSHDWYVVVNFPPYPSTLKSVQWLPYRQICSYRPSDHDYRDVELCESYAFHGWCSKGKDCPNSHHMDHIVTTLQTPAFKKRGGSKHSGPLNSPIASIMNAASTKQQFEASKQKEDRKVDEGLRVAQSVMGQVIRQEPFEVKEGMQLICDTHELEDKGKKNSERERDIERDKQNLEDNEVNGCKHSGTVESGSGDRSETHICDGTHGNEDDDREVVELEVDERDSGNDELEVVAVVADLTGKRKCQDQLGKCVTRTPAKRSKEEPPNSDKSADSDREKMTSNNNGIDRNNMGENSDRNTVGENNDRKDVLNPSCPDDTNGLPQRHTAGGHRAGYDAYMTGFVFACFLAHSRKLNKRPELFSPSNLGLQDEVNKIYLIGKNNPLLIRSSAFAKPSYNHTTKMLYLKESGLPL